ncbi:MAG: hypothetical protein AAF741_18200 [Bacteroidota bacterium]
MKIILLNFLLVLAYLPAFGQGVGISENGQDPDPSALLDVSSTDKGVLLPRMSTADREAIISPATGLIVFDNETETFWYRNSTDWINLEVGVFDPLVRLDNESVFVGENTADSLTSGQQNVVIGFGAAENIDQTSATIAIGHNTMNGLSGNGNTFNVAIGWNTAPNIEYGLGVPGGTSTSPFVGFGNSLVGSRIMEQSTLGALNAAMGYQALQRNTIGSDNAALGAFALNKNSSGAKNVAIGFRAGQENTTGTGNTSIGFDAGFNGSTNANSTYIGYLAQNDALANNYTNSTSIGYQSTVNESDQVRIGNLAVTDLGGYQPWSITADSSFSSNVAEDVPGLDFIRGLRPVSFDLNRNALATDNGQTYDPGDLPTNKETGFFGQEVETLLTGLGYDFNGLLVPQSSNTEYRLAYAQFVVPLTQAVQELADQVDGQNAQIDQLTQMVQALQAQVQALQEE